MNIRYISNRVLHLQLFISCVPFMMYAQSLSPSIFSSGGNYYQNPALSISQTVGELSLTKIFFNNLILTQGFQQPEIIINAVQGTGEEISFLQVYPNPSDEYFHISSHFNDFDECIIDISDDQGKIIDHQVLNNSIQSPNQITISTSEWKSGLYNLTIQLGRKGRIVHTNKKIMILRY